MLLLPFATSLLLLVATAAVAHRMNRRGAWVIAPALGPLVAIGAIFAGAGRDYDGMAFLVQSHQVGSFCVLTALLFLTALAVVGVKPKTADTEAR